MGLFRKQNVQKNEKPDNFYDSLIDQINHCKVEDLESLLQKIESEIERRSEKDRYLLSAKTMVTSKIALKNSSK